MKKRCMRVLCFLLILSLCLGFVPTRARQASAEEAEAEVSEIVSETQEEDQGDDQLEPVEPVSEGQSEPSVPEQEQPEETTPSVVVPGIVAPSGTEVTIITDTQPQEDQPEATPAIAEKERIVITLQPSVGSVNEGSMIRLEAAATGYDTAKWYFTDPGSAHIYSAANMFDGIEGISVKASSDCGKEILTIQNALIELNGWSVVCAFSSSAEANVQTTPVVFSICASETGRSASEKAESADQTTDGHEGNMPVVYGFNQSKKIGNVTVTVRAPEGAFEDGAKISVKRISLFERTDVEKAVEAARNAMATVVESYAFDIKVVDALGNELQPAEGTSAEVCFTLDLVQDINLEATIYHVSGDEATALETSVNAEDKEVSALTDGFSYYQVEFTYGELQYILPGNESVPLEDVLLFLGLKGEIDDALSSNPLLFSVTKNTEEKWIVTAEHAFDTNETLTLVLNGIEYEIVVTDASYSLVTNAGFQYVNNAWVERLSLYAYGIGRTFNPPGIVQCYSINNVPVYCVEPDRNISSTGYENINWQYPMNGAAFSDTQRDLLALVMACGYPNGTSGQDQIYERAATQMMVWNVVCGMMTEGSVGGIPVLSSNSSGFYFGEPSSCFNDGHPIRSAFVALWDRIYAARAITVGVPTWATAYGAANNILTLQYNSSTGLYEGTWTDASANFQYYNFNGSPVTGLTFTQSGATFSVKATPDVVASQNLGSVQTYFLRTASQANISVSTGNIIQFKPVQANGNIDWNKQTLQYYSPSAGQISYPQAYISLKANIVPLGHTFTITKTSSNPATRTNGAYSLANAVYGVYSDAACSSELERITTNASGNATTATAYTAGTYYVKEISPSQGFLLDETTHTLNLAADGTLTGDTTFTETPIFSRLTIAKTSANPDMTDGNSCYSLEGAQYGVYASASDANADINCLEVLTTDADGNATSTLDYLIGTYYMKELVASPGYMLDTSVHTVTLNSDGTLSGNSFTEQPGHDPSAIQIRKISSAGATIATITSGSATFKVEFFANDSWIGTADRTWYYKTINGICFLSNTAYLDTSYTNSPQYTDSHGNIIYPIGTVKISEVTPPAGYVATDQVWMARVYQETSGEDATWHWISAANGIIGYEAAGATVENEHRNGTIEVMKKAAQGNALPGVTFLLEYSTDNGTTWAPTYKIAADALTDYGACKSQDLVDGTLTTGATGKVVFEGLMADREIQYRLTEISAPDGYSLLSSPVYVGSLPVATTAIGIADTEEIDGTTYCYTLIFDVTDHSQYSLPSAGGNGFWQIPIAFIAAAVGIVLILRKKPRFG